MKILILIAVLFLTTSSYASQIQMYENKILLNTSPVEKVVVRGPELYVRSAVRPCASYPGFPDKIYGDVYECYTSREKLSQYLNDQNILNLPDSDLSQYIVAINRNFTCATRGQPNLVPYFGKNVYWFSGLLLATFPE